MYNITDLGTLGGDNSFATAINDGGAWLDGPKLKCLVQAPSSSMPSFGIAIGFLCGIWARRRLGPPALRLVSTRATKWSAGQ